MQLLIQRERHSKVAELDGVELVVSENEDVSALEVSVEEMFLRVQVVEGGSRDQDDIPWLQPLPWYRQRSCCACCAHLSLYYC